MVASVLKTAASGLNVSTQRVAAVADNIANVSTAGYRSSEIQSVSVATGQSGQAGGVTGGVAGVPRQLADPAGVLGAGAQEVQSQYSDTDVGREFASLIAAEAAYGASLKILGVADEMSQALLDETA